MNDYNSKIKDLIEVGKKIKKIPKFFEKDEVNGKNYQQIEEMIKKRDDKLNELINHQKNLASEIGLDKKPNLEKLIDSESSIQELLERPNYTYDDLSKLITQRDFYRVQNGYTNYNMKPLSKEEEKRARMELNKNINKNFIEANHQERDARKKFIDNFIKERKEKIKTNYKKSPIFLNDIPRNLESEQNAINELNKHINKPFVQSEIEKNKIESQRRQTFLKERKERKEKEFYDKKWYAKDSLPDRYTKKRKKEKIKRNIENRNSVIKKENINKEKRNTEVKKYKDFIDDYETNQEILKYDDFYKMYSPEKKEVQNFVNDPLNKLNYREAQINLSDEVNSKKSQKELSQIVKEKQTIHKKNYEKNYKKDEEFAKNYIDTKNKNLELEQNLNEIHVPLEQNLNEIHGPFLNKNFEDINPQLSEYQQNDKFLNKNKDQFDKIDENIKEKINNDINEKQTLKIFKETESKFKTDFYNDKTKLKDINKEMRILKKNRKNISSEEYQQKLNTLSKEKEKIKSNLKESRKSYLNRENPKLYEDEINKLNKDLKVLEDLDVFNKAQGKVDAGDMTREELDTLKNDLFGEGEVVAPKRTRKQIEEEIEKNKRLVKKFGGNAEREIEEDIVDTFKNKLKNTSKFNLIFSSVNAISQYKDSRKDGHGVVGSVARAGLDFALAETLGGLAYMGVSLAKELPGAAVKGTEMLHTEVRKMNTASRFSVFGQAQFQDTQQLATMRQSGMEMAKMANYRLEQTLMGNEAKYLHK